MTRIAIGGITVITASLVILLSTFNGIETMIEKLYSDFDPDITVSPVTGKTFHSSELPSRLIAQTPGVQHISRMIEEVVVVKHEQKWVNATLLGVDDSFLLGSEMKKHLVEGHSQIQAAGSSRALVGARLFEQLEGYLPHEIGEEQFILYAPKREAKIRPGSNPFSMERVTISGRFDFNKEVNGQFVVAPINLVENLLRYDNELTSYGIFLEKGQSMEQVKALVQEKVGDRFKVKTSLEKNALIFKTSQTEKVIVIVILLFVFVLACFNLVASITMIFVEKKQNMQTLICLGANQKTIERVFFIEGLLISGRGIISGLLIGYVICFLQLQFGWLTMPGTQGQAFPIALAISDGLLIVGSIGLLSILFSYFPVRSLTKKNFSHIRF